MQFGEFKLSIVRECTFKLDGGAMFGVVPKPLWNKVRPADEDNRVALSCNLLVIQTPQQTVLIETGMGPRWTDAERDRYQVNSLVDHNRMLESVGLTNDQVDAVIISHMHFDHIGGAVIERDNELATTFPRAKYYVQNGEYQLASSVNRRGSGSYRSADFLTIEQHGQLNKLDGDSEICPGIWVRVTGGHTSHHQVVTFESVGQKGVFFADIIPTSSHLPPPWVMGYDHYPLQSCDVKDEWLTRAATENWLVVFDHEIGVPWGHVEQGAQGKFAWRPLPIETLTVRR